MTLKLIPAGEFMMGSPDDDKDADADEKPQHKVRITQPFYLGVYEVTQAQYQAVMGNNPSCFSVNGGGKDKVAGQSTDQYPVEKVSWLDAVRFCNALSRKDGLNPFYEVNGEKVEIPDRNGPGYRLPTEAEWEYACRAGTTAKYSFGNDPSVLGNMGGLEGTRVAVLTPSARSVPTTLGCMTCTATSGSGVRTGTTVVITSSRRRTTRRGLPGPRTGCSAAGAGTTSPAMPVGVPRQFRAREAEQLPGLPRGPRGRRPLSSMTRITIGSSSGFSRTSPGEDRRRHRR